VAHPKQRILLISADMGVVIFDVLKHFSPDEATGLMAAIRAALAPGGHIILRVPDAGSPWGLRYQFGDPTHRTGSTPNRMRPLAIASELERVSLVSWTGCFMPISTRSC
jgi:hypothetical protein